MTSTAGASRRGKAVVTLRVIARVRKGERFSFKHGTVVYRKLSGSLYYDERTGQLWEHKTDLAWTRSVER